MKLTPEDRERLHKLLDYALDEEEDYVIAQYATMSLDWQLHRRLYRLNLKVEDEK
jgi:hypothetical protein